ncbi:metal-dependent hydrolase [Gemmobacter sp. LW-1]|uniref:metal-dependent hydrolase n=1 Tax=Gemmobacter sp. LW-1 TaxID=1529005 RepID=UPI0006C73A93|nr:metal-dependent hydrolase [Gemmobacter sp. LW-1]
MLTAHLPSGFIAGRQAQRHRTIPAAMPVALVASTLPDADMIWFHLVDHGSLHHHRYWVHIPAFWAVIAAITLPLLWRSRWRMTAILFFAVIFLHLILDTVGGGILWGVPFSDRLFSLITVPPDHGHWVASFLLHWSFGLELAIWVWAIWLWRRG